MVVIATPVVPGSGILQVTTVDRVKQFMSDEVEQTVENDPLIDTLITSVSQSFEKEMNRVIRVATYTDYPNVSAGQKFVYLKAYPVTSISEVSYDPTNRTFDVDDELDSSLYDVLDTDGILLMDRVQLVAGVKILKVTYLGGMASSTSDFIGKYPDISLAADITVAFWMRRKRKIEASSASSGGGGSVGLLDLKIPDAAKEILKRYVRRTNY